MTIETKLGKEHQNQKKEEVKIYGDAQVKLRHSWFVSFFTSENKMTANEAHVEIYVLRGLF